MAINNEKENVPGLKPKYYNMVYHYGGESQPLPTWKTYLYTLQQEAPNPRRIICHKEVPQRPSFYGKEYHGSITREGADSMLSEEDGCYLVRKSERALDAFTLAIRFEGQTKNFKLYYDGKHFVGEKRFDTVFDLVADGLIHFYLESHAADYIASLSNESNYAESPYLAFTAKRSRLARSQKSLCAKQLDYTDSRPAANGGDGTLLEQDPEPEAELEIADIQDIEKPHVFKLQNFIGLHWCDFCANFMWGLLAQGVKCQDCGFEAHKKCSERVPNDCMPDIKFVKSVFGADLTTLIKAHKTPIPSVVEKCVKEIEARGIESEGLYRIAGLHDDVACVRMAFDKDRENTDISPSKYDDINTITSALKLYFRLLPIPLITFESYKILMDAVKKESLPEQLASIKEALSIMAPAHFQTLHYLLGHLYRVTEKKSKNMMGSDNLAIVFAPTLMRCPENDPMASLLAAQFEQRAAELLLTHYKELFGKITNL